MRQLHRRLKDCEHPAREIRKESVDHRSVGKGMMALSSSAAEAEAAEAKDHGYLQLSCEAAMCHSLRLVYAWWIESGCLCSLELYIK